MYYIKSVFDHAFSLCNGHSETNVIEEGREERLLIAIDASPFVGLGYVEQLCGEEDNTTILFLC